MLKFCRRKAFITTSGWKKSGAMVYNNQLWLDTEMTTIQERH